MGILPFFTWVFYLSAVYIYPTPPPRSQCNTKVFFIGILIWIWSFSSLSSTGYFTKAKESVCLLFIHVREKLKGFMPFPRPIAQIIVQTLFCVLKHFTFFLSVQHLNCFNTLCKISFPSIAHKIHQLLLCRGVTPPTSVLDMTLNNLMVRFQQCWSFGNAEYPFIAIAPRSTLARSGSTW